MNKIYVGNLSYNISNDELSNFFTSFGSIRNINLIYDRDSGRPKGYGFIEFEENSAAQAAVDGGNGKELLGRPMKVSLAKQKEKGERSRY